MADEVVTFDEENKVRVLDRETYSEATELQSAADDFVASKQDAAKGGGG